MDRVSSKEKMNSSRGNGKTDAGAKNYEKSGFGQQTGMQRNPKKMPAPKF